MTTTKDSALNEGKVAIVTGSSRGIGASIARRLASEGFTVIVNYAGRAADADAVVAAIRAAGVTHQPSVQRLLAAVEPLQGMVVTQPRRFEQQSAPLEHGRLTRGCRQSRRGIGGV